MANWRALSERLAEVEDSIRLSWDELKGLVGALPASASRHRAWWSGDRPNVRIWRDSGFTIDNLVPGQEVTFVRHASAAVQPQDDIVEPAKVVTDEEHGPQLTDVEILLVTCVKSKLAQPAPARELYTSPLFVKQRAYAESSGLPWFILSAEHGLVRPDEWLAPYERYLKDTPAAYREAWGRWVAERLELLIGPLDGRVVEVHAGATYLQALHAPLRTKGVSLRDPLRGLSMGHRLSWYDTQVHSPEPGRISDPDRPESQAASAPPEHDYEDVQDFVDLLVDHASAVSPADFLEAGPTGLRSPGLYSWWVDQAGAADLTCGLGHPVSDGLVYAGLAGATRWPSGRRSTNTLWTRIADMHLGGRCEFSTFRLTLGSILADAAGRDAIDEAGLSDWMHRHLRVRAAVAPDPDTLGRVEQQVLARIDPPLNLQHMPSTPLRARLSQLRKTYGGR